MSSLASPPGSYVNRSGMTLSYGVKGSGDILVCHPGGPGFSSVCLRDLGGLDSARTLVLLNPRGTAESDRPADPRAYALEDYVHDLEDLRLHLGLESIDLLGQSHGGMVAMDYASRYPSRVSQLVLLSTLPRFAGAPKEAMEAAIARRSAEPRYQDAVAAMQGDDEGGVITDEEWNAQWRRALYLYFAKVGEIELAYIESWRDDRVNADAARLFGDEIIETFDLRPGLSRITARTLVVVGEHDFIAGPVCGAAIMAGIPAAELVTLPAGHFVFIECPDAFRAAALRFLAKASSDQT